jgi:thiol:disulfide interchange protein DsbA
MKLVYLLSFILLFGIAISGCTEDNGKKIDPSTLSGEFEIVPTMKNTHETGKVQMIEFFDFYCPHCYQLSLLLPVIEEKYQDKLVVDYRAYPLRQTSVPPIAAYIVAEKMGKGEEMMDAIFRAQWEKGMDIGDEDVLVELAVGVGLDESTFRSALKQGVEREIRENIQLGNRYVLRQTPTVIIDGNLKVEPTRGIEDMADNLDTIISSILQQDTQQR